MTNPILGFTELAAAQEQPEVPVNEATRMLGRAVGGEITIDFTSDADHTLVANTPPEPGDEWPFAVIRMTDAGTELSAPRAVIYPDVDSLYGGPSRLAFVLINDTAQTLTVKRSGQSGVDVPAGQRRAVMHDGSDIVPLLGEGAASDAYDVALFVVGSPEDSELLLQLVAVRAFVLPQDLAGSRGYAGVGADEAAAFALSKNGSSIGSVNFGAAAQTATFTFSAEQTFAPGDRLEITAPSTADAYLADVSITLRGTLS